MTKKINSAQVLYKRKSPATYDMMKAQFFKNLKALVDSGDDLRKKFATDAEWWAWLDENGGRETYCEAKAILKRAEGK